MDVGFAVTDKAFEEIDGAVSNAQSLIADTARSIEEIAKETVEQTLIASVNTLHESVQSLITRQGGDDDLDAFKSEVREFMGHVRTQLESIGAPVAAVTAAMNEIAAAADDAIEEAEAAAGEIADGEVDEPVFEVEAPIVPPKSKKKKLLKRKG